MDFNHLIGTDLVIDTGADIGLVQNPVEGQQRVLRRLLTNPKDYYWHTDYGAGLARYIGTPTNQIAISGNIIKQMKLEQAVVQSPPPKVKVDVNKAGEVIANILYVDADSQLTSSVIFPLST